MLDLSRLDLQAAEKVFQPASSSVISPRKQERTKGKKPVLMRGAEAIRRSETSGRLFFYPARVYFTRPIRPRKLYPTSVIARKEAELSRSNPVNSSPGGKMRTSRLELVGELPLADRAKKRTDRSGATSGSAIDNNARLTHVDRRGRVQMVDVGEKPITRREAIARAAVTMRPATLDAIVGGSLKKGEALAAARVAGIMAAKRTHELIPLCHQIPLELVEVDFHAEREHSTLEIQARAITQARTGVEMEALVAASTAALTIYDMAKASDRAMVIGAVRLVRKTGGRSGQYIRRGERRWPNGGETG